MKRYASHLYIGDASRGYELECRHCGERYRPALPVDLDVLMGMADGFAEVHNGCLPGNVRRPLAIELETSR